MNTERIFFDSCEDLVAEIYLLPIGISLAIKGDLWYYMNVKKRYYDLNVDIKEIVVMKLKKLLVMPLVAISILMVGCQKDVDSSDTVSTSSQVVLESVSVNTYHETMPIPVEGWTFEQAKEVAKTFYLNGKPIEDPFTIESLGDKYSINEEDSQILDSGACGVKLCYNDIELDCISINYTDIQNFEQLQTKEPSAISVNIFDDDPHAYSDIIVFNGIRLGASIDEVESVFGVSDKKTDTAICYAVGNTSKNSIGFFFNNEGKLYAFSIIFYDPIDQYTN